MMGRACSLASRRPSSSMSGWRVERSHAVMVGDRYANDVEGARAGGPRAVWVDRGGPGAGEGQRIARLGHLPAVRAGEC